MDLVQYYIDALCKVNDSFSMLKTENKPEKSGRIEVLDFIRALAIIHVFVFHYYMEWFKGSFMLIPQGIQANLPRLEIFKDGGIIGLIKNLFSFLFFYGFSAVNVFLVVSGFVLTYSLLSKKNKSEQLGGGSRNGIFKWIWGWLIYYWKKFKRILLPFYASVVVGIFLLYFRNIVFPTLAGAPVYNWIDGLKLLFFPFLVFDMALVQKFNGDYWFVPLILQMYLIFPFLFFLLKKMKVLKFLILMLIICASFRFYATYFLDSVPIAVSWPSKNGYLYFSFFLPRIFEFSFGMVLGYLHYFKGGVLAFLGRIRFFALGAIMAYTGYVFLMYKWGWVFSDLLMGTGLFPMLLGLANLIAKNKWGEIALKKIGKLSYPIYLLHHYFLNYTLLPLLIVLGLAGNETAFWLVLLPYSILSVGLGQVAEWLELAWSMLLGSLKSRLIPRADLSPNLKFPGRYPP